VAWTPQRLVRWAQLSGPSVAALVETILTRHVHAQRGFRSCLGILRLGQRYGGQRLASRSFALAGETIRFLLLPRRSPGHFLTLAPSGRATVNR
jgi:hypothetical protein